LLYRLSYCGFAEGARSRERGVFDINRALFSKQFFASHFSQGIA
jgi:hypothetical protein